MVAEVLNSKEREVTLYTLDFHASTLYLLIIVYFYFVFSKVDAEVNTFKISKKIVDDAGNVQEEMCIYHRTRCHFSSNVFILMLFLHAERTLR